MERREHSANRYSGQIEALVDMLSSNVILEFQKRLDDRGLPLLFTHFEALIRRFGHSQRFLELLVISRRPNFYNSNRLLSRLQAVKK